MRWLAGWLAGWLWLAAYVVGLGGGFVFVGFRRIPSDSIKTIMIPAKQSRRQLFVPSR
ncbi:hypothetical protein K1119_004017 [Salmonella enterica]|nr:hypothetical protein [Salmonella enterica]